MNKYEVGIITDGEIGCNFALNLSSKGHSTVIYNTDIESMRRMDIDNYIQEIQQNGVAAATSTQMLVNLLEKPRKIFIISRRTLYSEDILQELFELLDDNDIIFDTCDINYKVSAGRCRNFEKKGIAYLGAGLSVTKKEMLNGASIVVGGSRDAFESIRDILESVASRYAERTCCKYVGPDGAGQYVKMIHNGIEYGIMHTISEAISVLKNIEGIDREQLSEIVYEWSVGNNESYLLQAAHDILSREDDNTEDLLTELVADKVGYGKSVAWLICNSMELSVSIPSIYTALTSRFMSNVKCNRSEMSEDTGNTTESIRIINDIKNEFIYDVQNSLYLSSLCIYAQAFHLLKRASDLYIWGTSVLDVAVAFRGGSFVNSRILDRIIDIYNKKTEPKHLFEDVYFKNEIKRCLPSLKRVVNVAIENGISISVISQAINYINLYSLEKLDVGFVELMRDYIQQSGFELETQPKIKYTADWDKYEKRTKIYEIIK